MARVKTRHFPGARVDTAMQGETGPRACKLPWRCVSTEAPSALEQWVQWGGPFDHAAASIRSQRLWPSIEKNDMAPHVSISGGHGIDLATAQRSPHVGASSAASFAGP
jgi:hypothetical protein